MNKLILDKQIADHMKILMTSILTTFLCICAYGQEATLDERVIIAEISTDKSYGLKKKTNIKVGSVANEYAFIAQLTGPNGEKVSAKRIGSCCAVKSKNSPFGKALLDKWEIKYDGLEKPIILFLNAYDFEKPKCPKGLGFKSL